MDEKKCKHGLVSVVNTSWSDSDPARRYLVCPNNEHDVCDFFEWIDPNVTDIQRHYIQQLREDRDFYQDQLFLLHDEYRKIVISESIASNIAAQCRKERDDLQQQLRIKDFDCRQLKEAHEKDVTSNEHLTVANVELTEELDSLKSEIWWKNYTIAALVIGLVVVSR